MAEHAIPQDILSYEFKLFAGLTWKQFVYVAIGVVFGVILIQSSTKGYIPPIIGYPFGIIAIILPLSMAFIKIGDRPMEEIILDAIRVFNMPLIRVWLKNQKYVSLKNALNSKPSTFPSYVAELLEIDFNEATAGGIKIKHNYIQNVVKTAQETLFLNPDNAHDYAVPNVTLPNIPNTVAFLITTPQGALPDVIATLKNSAGEIVQSLKSNEKGIIYFNKQIPSGTYTISFSHPKYNLPTVTIEMTGATYPLIKLVPIGNE